MISKHIYLTEELDRQVQLAALREKKPEAAVIRERLHAGFAAGRPAPIGGTRCLVSWRWHGTP